MKPTKQPEIGPRDPWTVWRERPAAPDDVCRALANGSTLKQWTQSYNFDYFEVAHWLLDNPTRAYNYERSLQIYAHYLRDEILELADDSSQDILTDAKGKTTLNHAHFRRQGRQIEARKAIIRQITTGKKPLKDQEPYADVEAEINKILTQPGPYDPKGTLKGYKPSQPAYDPGPPPLSRPSPSSQSAIAPVAPPSPYAGIRIPPDALETLSRGLREYNQAKEAAAATTPHSALTASPLPHPTPNLPPASQSALDGHLTKVPVQTGPSSETQGPVTHHASRTASPEVPSPTTPVGQPTFPSYRAYLRAIWESGWVEGTPLPFVYRPTPDALHPKASQDEVVSQSTIAAAPSLPNPTLTPNPPAASQPSMDGPPAASPALTTDPPGPTAPKLRPKTYDWYKFLGIRQLSAFLTLFILFFVTATTNLHASIHSLAIPLAAKTKKQCPCPLVPPQTPFVFISVHSWFTTLPPSGFRLPTSSGIRNPSAHSHRSRDAPFFH